MAILAEDDGNCNPTFLAGTTLADLYDAKALRNALVTYNVMEAIKKDISLAEVKALLDGLIINNIFKNP